MRKILISIRSAARTLQAAIATSAAVEAHRAPSARELRRLGINPSHFNAIKL